jgi:uncharacterized protein with GYD domain
MARFLSKLTLSNQGWSALVSNPQNRFEAVRPSFESMGGKLLEYWYAVDESAIYVLFEGLEDPIAREAMNMATLSGNVTGFQMTQILNVQEAMEAMKKAKTLAYRPAVPVKK